MCFASPFEFHVFSGSLHQYAHGTWNRLCAASRCRMFRCRMFTLNLLKVLACRGCLALVRSAMEFSLRPQSATQVGFKLSPRPCN